MGREAIRKAFRRREQAIGQARQRVTLKILEEERLAKWNQAKDSLLEHAKRKILELREQGDNAIFEYLAGKFHSNNLPTKTIMVSTPSNDHYSLTKHFMQQNGVKPTVVKCQGAKVRGTRPSWIIVDDLEADEVRDNGHSRD